MRGFGDFWAKKFPGPRRGRGVGNVCGSMGGLACRVGDVVEGGRCELDLARHGFNVPQPGGLRLSGADDAAAACEDCGL